MAPSDASVQKEPEDPLHSVREKAHIDDTYVNGTYHEFGSLKGVSLAGKRTVKLLDLGGAATALKVVGKLARVHLDGSTPQFAGGEHIAIGDSIWLKLNKTDPGRRAYDIKLLNITRRHGSLAPVKFELTY